MKENLSSKYCLLPRRCKSGFDLNKSSSRRWWSSSSLLWLMEQTDVQKTHFQPQTSKNPHFHNQAGTRVAYSYLLALSFQDILEKKSKHGHYRKSVRRSRAAAAFLARRGAVPEVSACAVLVECGTPREFDCSRIVR